MAATAIDRATGLASSAAFKAPVYVATTANIALSGLLTIDGVALTAGKRVLVKDQSVPAQNGIYIAAASDWQRAPDLTSNDSVREGTRVYVTDGATQAGTEYVVTTSDPISIGTSSITFALSSVAAALPGVIALASDEAFVDADMLIARQASSGNIIKHSWANVKNLIRTALGAMVSASGAKSTPVDADQVLLSDSASSNATAKLSWANIKATLNTYFQGLASLTLVAGDILYASGANTLARLAKGTAGQVLTMNPGATAPMWSTPASSGWDMTGQTWQTVTRSSGVSYQNATGKPIQVVCWDRLSGSTETLIFEVSPNNSTWTTVVNAAGSGASSTAAATPCIVIPPGYYYKCNNFNSPRELR